MKTYRSAKAGKEILRTYDLLVRSWKTEASEMDVATRYGYTHVITAGREDAPPIVLFHGVGDDAALMWIYNAKALAAHFRIHAVDTLGGSGKSRPDMCYDQTFDDVLWMDDVMDGLGLKSACLAGVSHGGYLVQLYTLMRPGRVQKAAALSSSVHCAGGSGSPMKAMIKVFLPEALFPSKRNVEKLVRKLSGKHADAFLNHPTIMEHYRCLLKGFNNMAMRYHRVRTFSEDEIAQIRPRVLYLVGEADPFQTLGGEEALRVNRMNAIFYPDAGHGLNHELSEEINERLIVYFTD